MRNRTIVGVLLCLSGTPVAAQEIVRDTATRDSVNHSRAARAPKEPAFMLVATSLGLPGFGSETEVRAFTLGLQLTQVQANRLGADFAVGTMPYLLTNGFGVLGMRAGTALALDLGQGTFLLPSFGASMIFVGGEGDGGAAVGLNAGIAIAALRSGSSGVSTGITWHSLTGIDRGFWLAEIGIAFAPGRKR